MMADELTRIAAELYTAKPSEFIAERTARAKGLADRGLAERVRVLRRPSVAAWVVNVFAQERADRLAQALQLAEELREAQADLDAPALAKLGQQRRALTSQLAREAASLAEDRGERVTESTVEAVRQTLSAAFFDPDAAAAVASGRLIRELEPAGQSPLDLEATVAGGPPASPSPAPRRVDEVTERRERRDAERAVRAAEQELARAQREHDELARDQRDATSRADRLGEQIVDLEAELARVRADAERAAAALGDLPERLAAAADRVDGAERALADARAAREHPQRTRGPSGAEPGDGPGSGTS
ncbi:type II secretory pathway component HofQ [Microbacterium sp. W4I4]|uniref:transposase n=1 Tax=Microbacterium sp. W4I4 TaxID=3042295 RepID=UPI002783E68E|nr:transposase [Microbacterium sp. W4I4]MDQ0613294.1 type II secretory pathway component HofQ [Microbacterium sp. W4I4]